MMNFSFPANAKMFSNLLLQIINAEVLDPEWTTELVYDFTRDRDMMDLVEETNKETILIDQIQENGFENFNPILNLGGIFVIFTIYLARVLLFVCLKILAWAFRLCNRINRISTKFEGGRSRIMSISKTSNRLSLKLKKDLFFNLFPVIIFESVF